MVEVLYKYMTAERVLTCLPEVGDRSLRATQPAALNDPFECAVRAMFIEFGWDELRLNQEFAEILSSIHGTTPVSEEEVAQAKEEHGSLYLRNLFAMQLSQKYGIVSFTEGPNRLLNKGVHVRNRRVKSLMPGSCWRKLCRSHGTFSPFGFADRPSWGHRA